jgi:hypothetical protein
MVNTKMFRHPKYYKELRRAGVQVNSSRPAHSRCNKSDQAISLKAHDGERERASWSGPQASGCKLQAPGVKLSNQPVQASGGKRQAPGSKLQASSHKLQAP